MENNEQSFTGVGKSGGAVAAALQLGGLGVAGEAKRRSGQSQAKQRGLAGVKGKGDQIFHTVLLVPHMGIGQSTALGWEVRGEGGKRSKVTLSSSRPGLFLAAPSTPAALAGPFLAVEGVCVASAG